MHVSRFQKQSVLNLSGSCFYAAVALGLSADQVLKRLQPSVALFQRPFIPPSRRRCLHPRQAQLQQIHLHFGIARSLS